MEWWAISAARTAMMDRGSVQLWKVPSRVTKGMATRQVMTSSREMEASRSGESARSDSRSIWSGGRVSSWELRRDPGGELPGSFIDMGARYPGLAPRSRRRGALEEGRRFGAGRLRRPPGAAHQRPGLFAPSGGHQQAHRLERAGVGGIPAV